MNTHLTTILTTHNIPFTPHTFTESVHSVAEAQAQTGGQDHEMIKNVCCITKSGKLLIVILLGSARLDFKALKSHCGEAVSMAKPEQVVEGTGFAVGGVPSFGIKEVEYYMDEQVLDSERVFTSGGDDRSLIELAPQDMLSLHSYHIGLWHKS